MIEKGLENLPLALVRAGTYAHQHRCFRNYFNIYFKNCAKLLRGGSLLEVDHYRFSVYATFEISSEAFPQKARRLHSIPSFFHHSEISRDLFIILTSKNFFLILGSSTSLACKGLLNNFNPYSLLTTNGMDLAFSKTSTLCKCIILFWVYTRRNTLTSRSILYSHVGRRTAFLTMIKPITKLCLLV